MARILIVEDEEKIARFVTLELEHEGYQVEHAADGRTAVDLALERNYDLILLDVLLPQLNGMEVLRRVRKHKDVPVIMVTARDAVMDKVAGLDAGADDYLTKPFKLGVLLSRVNALLRRANASSAGEPVLESGSITVRLLQGQAYKNGILLELTSAEYKLLCFFMQHPNAVLSKEQILDALWDCDGDYIDSSALTVYIRRLRMKIEDDPGKPQMLLTVRGMGYKWNG